MSSLTDHDREQNRMTRAAERSARKAAARKLAIEQYASDGCEFDDGARVEIVKGGGAWVQAWCWIGADELNPGMEA